MGVLSRLLKKTGWLVRREQFAEDLTEEMAFHREMKEREAIGRGAAPDAARRAAQLEFGNTAHLRDASRDVVGFSLESLVYDIRFALRQLRKNPGFAATVLVMLTVGFGATVSIFAFVDAALLKPLPYSDPNRLAGVYEHTDHCDRCNLSYQDYLDWKKDNKVFQSLDAWSFSGHLWRGPAATLPVTGIRISGGFLNTLGVVPALGRNLNSADDNPAAPRTVMLSWTGWKTRFAGRQDIVNQVITLDDVAYSVVGVLPETFHFAPLDSEFWETFHDPNSCEKRRSCHNLYALARLKDGVSVATADANAKSIAANLEKQYPASNRGQAGLVIPLSEAILGNIRPILLVLLAGAELLLLIACVNVASLLLVRGESRKREMAVRGALGVSRSRLLRQFTTESLVLVATALPLALLGSYETIHLLHSLIPQNALQAMPYLQDVHLSGHVVSFALLSALLAAGVFSVTPALRLSMSSLMEDLAEGGRGSAGSLWRRFGTKLVAVELALALVLLSGAGLLGKSLYRLLHVDLNFVPDNLATLRLSAPDATYGKNPQAITLSHQVLDRMMAIPGVVSAGHTAMLPVSCNCNTTWFRVLGQPYNGVHNDAPQRQVSRDFFRTIQARVIRGRLFTEADTPTSTPVVVINQALAQRYFPGQDPIDKSIGDTDLSPASMRQIVGVVDDVREGALDQDVWPTVYYPFDQQPNDSFALVVRTTQDPESALPEIVKAIHEIDPGIGVANEITMPQYIHLSQTAYLHRAAAWLVGGFAAIALLLGVIGLYGVIAYSVSRRTREIGVRMALGAQRAAVYRMVLGEAGMLIAIGVGVGLTASVFTAMLMRKLLFGVAVWDLSTLLAVASLLGLSALLASFLPARSAASVNPVEALRVE